MENKQEIAEANLGLVHACARRFKGRGIEYDDLFSAGCVGLLKAINNFDQDRGIKFSTYAVPVILGEIKQLFRDGGTVKVSRSLKELSMKASKVSDEYLRKHGEEITVNKLAEILETEPEKVSEALNASRLPVSLNNLDRDGDEYVTDIPVDSVEEKLSEIISLRQAVRDLNDDDKKIFLQELGIQHSGLDRLIFATYSLLGLETFFTAGADECRAWTFRKGANAKSCAGLIHSDIERGFIKAEVMSFDDLEKYGSELKVKEAGKLRLEGKDYLMQDGDIVYFRFNV